MIQCNRFLCMEERGICISVQLRARWHVGNFYPATRTEPTAISVSLTESKRVFSAMISFLQMSSLL